MAQYLPRRSPPPRLLVDFVDVDSEKWAEYAARKTFPPDRSIAARRGNCFGLTAASLRKLTPVFLSQNQKPNFFGRSHRRLREKILAIPNGMDATYFSPGNAGPKPELGGTPSSCSPAGWIIGRMSMPWFGSVTPCYQSYAKRFPKCHLLHRGRKALSRRPGAQRATGDRGHRCGADVRPYVGMRTSWLRPCALGGASKTKSSKVWPWRDR